MSGPTTRNHGYNIKAPREFGIVLLPANPPQCSFGYALLRSHCNTVQSRLFRIASLDFDNSNCVAFARDNINFT